MTDLDPRLAENLANWNSRVPLHTAPDGYGIDKYVEDRERLSDVVAFDAKVLGDLTGMSVVHLQCHIGTDTLSLARLGAKEVVGIDFSDAAISAARELVERTGDNTRFVLSDVYNAAATVGQKFDLLYTSVGVISWLDNIERWAENVAGLLRSGGRFVFRDLHPTMWPFEEVDGQIVPTFKYWQSRDEALVFEETTSYRGTGEVASPRTNSWNHTISSVLNALIGAGLRIDHLDEHPEVDWQLFPSAVAKGTQWILPETLHGKLPVCWTVTATKT